MVTLVDLQNEIQRQMDRDWSEKSVDTQMEISLHGLAEESGEVSGLRKRELRDLPADRPRCTKEKYVEELGDVLWYLVAVCNLKGIQLEDLWEYNCEKLMGRYGE